MDVWPEKLRSWTALITHTHTAWLCMCMFDLSGYSVHPDQISLSWWIFFLFCFHWIKFFFNIFCHVVKLRRRQATFTSVGQRICVRSTLLHRCHLEPKRCNPNSILNATWNQIWIPSMNLLLGVKESVLSCVCVSWICSFLGHYHGNQWQEQITQTVLSSLCLSMTHRLYLVKFLTSLETALAFCFGASLSESPGGWNDSLQAQTCWV